MQSQTSIHTPSSLTPPTHSHTHIFTQELEGRPSDEESSSDESDEETWQEIRRERKQAAAAAIVTATSSSSAEQRDSVSGLTMVPGTVGLGALKKPSK